EPARASGARSYSWKSVSQSTTPSPEPGSYDLITPCIEAPRSGRRTLTDHRNGAVQAPARWATRRPGHASSPPPPAPPRGLPHRPRTRRGRPGGRPQVEQVAAGPPRSADALGDLAGPDAARADVEALRGAVHDGPHPLDVRVPPTLGAPVRVADVHPEGRVLPAHLAHCCHRRGPLTWGDNGARTRRAGPRNVTGGPAPPPTRTARRRA